MEATPPPPAPGEVPATHEDLRGLRRWIVVGVVWAVAATAVALIALLDNSQDDAAKRAGDAEGRAAAVERRLGDRIDELERRLEAAPRAEDVSNLQERLKRSEDRVDSAAEDAQSAAGRAGDLEDRVETLEEEAASAPQDQDSP